MGKTFGSLFVQKMISFIFGCGGSSVRFGLSGCGAEPPAAVAPLVAERGLQAPGFSNGGMWLSGVRPGLQSTGLVAPRHVRSSQIRDQTPISYIGRWILYH